MLSHVSLSVDKNIMLMHLVLKERDEKTNKLAMEPATIRIRVKALVYSYAIRSSTGEGAEERARKLGDCVNKAFELSTSVNFPISQLPPDPRREDYSLAQVALTDVFFSTYGCMKFGVVRFPGWEEADKRIDVQNLPKLSDKIKNAFDWIHTLRGSKTRESTGMKPPEHLAGEALEYSLNHVVYSTSGRDGFINEKPSYSYPDIVWARRKENA